MEEVVDGTLQGSLDEVVLQSLGSILLQGPVGNEVSIGVDQAPLGTDEVLVVLSLIGSQESISLLFHSPNLSGIELSLNFEDTIQQLIYLGLRDLLLGHQNGLLLKLRDVVTTMDENFLSSVKSSLDGFGMTKTDLVCSLLEGQIELVLTDDSERGDGGLQGGASTVGVLEDNVGSHCVSHQVELRELSDDVDELVVLTSFQEPQAFGDHGVDEVKAFDVLNDFELGTNHSVSGIRVFPLGAEGPGDGSPVLQKDRNLLHSVVQMRELESFFHSGGLGDVSSDVGPGSSTSSSHFVVLLKIVSW